MLSTLTLTSAGVILIIPPTKSWWGLFGSLHCEAESWLRGGPKSDMQWPTSGSIARFASWWPIPLAQFRAVEWGTKWLLSVGTSEESNSSNFPSNRLPWTDSVQNRNFSMIISEDMHSTRSLFKTCKSWEPYSSFIKVSFLLSLNYMQFFRKMRFKQKNTKGKEGRGKPHKVHINGPHSTAKQDLKPPVRILYSLWRAHTKSDSTIWKRTIW